MGTWTISVAFTSCSHNESGIPADATPPTIKVHFSSVEITGEEVIRVSGNELYIGDKLVAEWTDNVTKDCKVQMKLDGVVIASGNVLTHSWTLTLTVTDDEGNSKSVTIYLVMEEVYPEITVLMPTVNVFGDAVLQITDSQLLIDDKEVAKWSDKHTEKCKVSVAFNGKEVKSGDVVNESGTLFVTVTNNQGNETTAEIIMKEEVYPEVCLLQTMVNVFGGAEIQITDSQLLIDGSVVAEWSDKHTEKCKVSVTFNGKEVKSGDILNEAGTLVVTVTNDQDNSSTAKITVTNDAIYWLENLKNLDMQVDQEVDLLSWLTLAEWVQLLKVQIEIDGQYNEIADPHHYIPDYPWTCSITFTVQWKSWESKEIKVDNLNIKALEYKEACLNTADMIKEKYPRYNKLRQVSKEFIYPHLLASYTASNRSKQDNRVHIIMGETADTDDIENIWQFTTPSNHAYQWYYRIRTLCPNIPIKWCYDYRANLENYINQHPNDFFLISCAAGSWWWRNREEFKNNKETAPQERLLKNKNVIILCSVGNIAESWRKMYNENIKNWNRYQESSTNSRLNNKITITGYNPWKANSYFSPSFKEYWWLRSAMPVWFDKDKGNIVMPMIPLINSNNQEDTNTDSSCPTAVTSGVVWNAISIIMSTHPDITPVDAMDIIVDKYLIAERFQYKDETTNWELVDGDYRYFIDMLKLLNNELLQSKQIESIQLNSNHVELPSSPWICYIGKWIQFEYDGQLYDMTTDNQTIIKEALQSGNVKWYWNKKIFKKYGGIGTAIIDAYVVDKAGKKIPDLHLSVNKTVTQ